MINQSKHRPLILITFLLLLVSFPAAAEDPLAPGALDGKEFTSVKKHDVGLTPEGVAYEHTWMIFKDNIAEWQLGDASMRAWYQMDSSGAITAWWPYNLQGKYLSWDERSQAAWSVFGFYDTKTGKLVWSGKEYEENRKTAQT